MAEYLYSPLESEKSLGTEDYDNGSEFDSYSSTDSFEILSQHEDLKKSFDNTSSSENLSGENLELIFSEFIKIQDADLKGLSMEQANKYVRLLRQNIYHLRKDIPKSIIIILHFMKLINLNANTVEYMRTCQVEIKFTDLLSRYLDELLSKDLNSDDIHNVELIVKSIYKLQYFDFTQFNAEKESYSTTNTRIEIEKKVLQLFSVASKQVFVNEIDVSSLQENVLIVVYKIFIKRGLWSLKEVLLDQQALQFCINNNNDVIRHLSLYLLVHIEGKETIEKEVVTRTLDWTKEAFNNTTLTSHNGLHLTVLLYGLQLISHIDLLALGSTAEQLNELALNICGMWNENCKTYQSIMTSIIITLYNQFVKSKDCKELSIIPLELLKNVMEAKDVTLKMTATLIFIYQLSLINQTVPTLSDETLIILWEWLKEAYLSSNKLCKDMFQCKDLMSAMDKIVANPQNKLKLEKHLSNLDRDLHIEELIQKYGFKVNCISTSYKVPKDRSDKHIKMKSIDILLVGKTGEGKSSTGNTILDKEVFLASDSLTSVTSKKKLAKRIFKDRIIEVVDTPGLEDTENMEDIEKSVERIFKILQIAILKHPQGYHAFLIPLRYGTRFRREDKMVVEMLKDIFGDEVVRNYSILIFTHGDVFKSQKSNKNKKFKTWCHEQTGVFKEIFEECGKRAVLFDNITEDPIVKKKQLQKLIAKIDSLNNNGRRYKDDHFQTAEERRQLLIMKYKVDRITEETKKETDSFLEKIKSIDNLEPDEQLDLLKNVYDSCTILEHKIETVDKGKNVFIMAKNLIAIIKQAIELRKNTAQRIKEKNELESKERELINIYEKLFIKFKEEESMKSVQENEEMKQQLERTKETVTNCQNQILILKDKVHTNEKKYKSYLTEIEHNYVSTISDLIHKSDKLSDELEEKTSTFLKRLKHLVPWSRLLCWRKERRTSTCKSHENVLEQSETELNNL